MDAIRFRDIFLLYKKVTSSYNYLLTLIDLSNIVNVTISSPTLSQGVLAGFVSSFFDICKIKCYFYNFETTLMARFIH